MRVVLSVILGLLASVVLATTPPPAEPWKTERSTLEWIKQQNASWHSFHFQMLTNATQPFLASIPDERVHRAELEYHIAKAQDAYRRGFRERLVEYRREYMELVDDGTVPYAHLAVPATPSNATATERESTKP